MNIKLKALYELQSIDLQLAKLQKARASLDDGSAKKLEVEAARREAEAAEKQLHETSTELRDNELNLKTVETKQKSFRDKLYAGKVTNPKELSSMEKEIEMLGRQKGKLEERILELMDIVEEQKTSLESAQSVLKQRENELEELLGKTRQQETALIREIKQLLPQREQAATAVDPVLLKRYEATRVRLAGSVVSRVLDDNCSVCHTQIGVGLIRDLKSGEEIQTCDNCGRMLLLE